MNLWHAIIRFFLSIRLTVVCLLLLSILTFFGTLYQVDYGLYMAQQRYFNSWVILFWGFIPFPGTQLVLTFLFFNLLANMVVRFTYGWKQLGIVMIHMGLLLMLAGGWITRMHGQESFLSLIEGEGSNLSLSYHDWEISAWHSPSGPIRDVVAYDATYATPAQVLSFEEFGLTVEVEEFYRNARALRATDPEVAARVVNASGITFVEEVRPSWDPQDNVPGGTFIARNAAGETVRMVLFGEERQPTTISNGREDITFSLRRKRHSLPIMVRLINFTSEFHPNSDIPKSFSSLIEVELGGVTRDALVEMNQPFRYQGYTFYQASYADLDESRQLSTFAIALNYGRIIPYVATGLTFLGLALHFTIQLYRRRDPVRTPPGSNRSPGVRPSHTQDSSDVEGGVTRRRGETS